MLKKITQQIHNWLINQAKTISVAESCTGGELCSLLTSLPGSSSYFILGVVTYSNKSKELILNIPAKKIARHGAVSRQIAILMAQNIRKKTDADFGLSITGIAGPAGATAAKPIGTVYICLSGKNKNICRKFNFSGNRESIRKKSVQEALRLLKKGTTTGQKQGDGSLKKENRPLV
ncbi:MAG: CinA family protein [Candidatus Omnitrophota bacterium]